MSKPPPKGSSSSEPAGASEKPSSPSASSSSSKPTGASHKPAPAVTTNPAPTMTATTADSRKRPPSASDTPNSTGGDSSSSKNKPHKKRPYRRTKRPKDYNDKSTITTTTESVAQQNAYDAVLAESQDLWQAAAEAQQLGRLKMASAYMLLLHARLVGLGKRFDRARRQQPVQKKEEQSVPAVVVETAAEVNEKDETGVAGSPLKKRKHTRSSAAKTEAATKGSSTESSKTPLPPTPTAPGTGQSRKTSTPAAATTTTAAAAAATATATTTSTTPKTQAARTLARMLPNDIAFDSAMMEHLAKAAAELHAARSGRHHSQSHNSSSKHPHHTLLSSPDAREFLAATANSQGVTNAATSVAAWSRKEVDCIDLALYKGQTTREMTTALPGRTEQQVKAFIRNRQERARVAADFELTPAAAAADETATGSSPKKNSSSSSSNINKGGRARKPVTTAMNTVPNANCDARALLQGGLLEQLDGDIGGQEEGNKEEDEEENKKTEGEASTLTV